MFTFHDHDARASWNYAAEAWCAFIRTGADYYRHEVHGPGLLAACEPVAGLEVLDLGCGEGYFSRELARRGATVTGIDLAEALLEYARQQEDREPLGIAFRHLSATELTGHFREAAFDLVTGCMSVQDMSDVPAVLAGARRVLRPHGRLVFSVPHPGTDTPFRAWERDEAGNKGPLRIDHYFETGPTICNWNMVRLRYPWSTPYWRCTLTEWTAMTAAAGFLIRRLHEPRPTAEQVAARPQLEDNRRLPYFLIFDLVVS